MSNFIELTARGSYHDKILVNMDLVLSVRSSNRGEKIHSYLLFANSTIRVIESPSVILNMLNYTESASSCDTPMLSHSEKDK